MTTFDGIPTIELPTHEGALYALERRGGQYFKDVMELNPQADPMKPMTSFLAVRHEIDEREYYALGRANMDHFTYLDAGPNGSYRSYSLESQYRASYSAMIERAELADLDATTGALVGQEGVA